RKLPVPRELRFPQSPRARKGQRGLTSAATGEDGYFSIFTAAHLFHPCPGNFVMAEKPKHNYDESKVKTLSSLEHIRLRTGMYVGRLGDGSHYDDGCYILLKEV